MSTGGFHPQRRSLERMLQVRISSEQHEELKRLADWFECNVSDIIRHGADRAVEELRQTMKESVAVLQDEMDELIKDYPWQDRQYHLDGVMDLYRTVPRGSERERRFQAMMWAHVNLWAEDFRSRVEELVAEKTPGAADRGLETDNKE